MRRLRAPVMLAALVLPWLGSACRLDADYGNTRFLCSDGRCPAGFACVAGACVAGAEDGGGEPDAAADAGGPAIDAAAQPDAAPVACGRPDVFTDDFGDGDLGTLWGWGWQTAGTTISETAGQAVFTMTGTSGSNYAGYATSRWFDLADGRFFIEVPVMANTSTHAQADFHVINAEDETSRLEFLQDQGTLYLRDRLGGVTTDVMTLPYDPTLHRWWQLRSEGGWTFWETSQDGSSWDFQAMIPDPPFIHNARIEMMAGTYQAETSPGEVHVDNFNGGGPPAGRWCPADSRTDDFEDGVQGVLWSRSYGSVCVRDETGGQATFTPDGTTSAYCGYVSGTSFDLTGRSGTIELLQAPDPAADGALAYFKAEYDQSNSIEFLVAHGTMYYRLWVDGSVTIVDSEPYSATVHKWLRLREEGGNGLWEVSDGTTWNQAASAALPFPMTRVDFVFGAGTTMATAVPPGIVKFDNFNLPP